MKRISILLTLAAIVAGGALFHACQHDDGMIMNPNAKGGGSTIVLFGVVELPDCAEACLEDGPFEQITQSWETQWAPVTGFSGYFKNNKYFITTAWNDGNNFYIKTTMFGYQDDRYNTNTGSGAPVWALSDRTYENYPFTRLKISVNGVLYSFYFGEEPEVGDIQIEEVAATEYIASFLLSDFFPEGWEKCDEVEYTVRAEGNGQPIWLGTSATQTELIYSLYDSCDCQDYFEGILDGEPVPTTITYDHPQHGTVTKDALTFTLKFTVTLCEETSDVTVQGGLTAGGPAGANDVSCDPEYGELFNPSQNVVRWSDLHFDVGETKDFFVTYTRQFTDCGPQDISGTWKVFINGDDENPVLIFDPISYTHKPCDK